MINKDAETFASVHSGKFNVSSTTKSSPESEKPKNLRKNVSFSSDNGYTLNVSSPSDEDLSEDSSNKNKSILKNGSNNNLITGKTRIGFNVGSDSESTANTDNKKPTKNEAYEILVWTFLIFI